MPAMINVFYGDQIKNNPTTGSKKKQTFPSKNKPFDELINSPKFFSKYFAGNITFFANEPGTGHVHHHSGSHDELTNPHRDARQTGQVSFDITSLIKRQKMISISTIKSFLILTPPKSTHRSSPKDSS